MSSAVRLLRLFQWFILVVALNSVLAQQRLRLLAGDRCPLPNRAQGVCRLLSNCGSARNQLRRWQARPETERPPVVCGVSGAGSRQAPVVCCDKNAETTRDPATRPPVGITNPTRGPFTPTRPTVGNPTKGPLTLSRITMAGMKSMEACDDLSKELWPRIIPLIHGGANTIKGEFPHMALLGYRSIDNTAILWNCGGALISRRYVLTAAHCIIIRTRNHGPAVRVRLGEFDLRRNNDGELDFGIEKATTHPDYKANAWYNDIALVRLDEDVTYSAIILPACLYTESEDPMGGLVITGWGATTSTGDVKSSILQKGNRSLDLVPASTCQSIYFSQGAANRLSLGVNSGMFCAVDPAAIVDTCQGDSGGPIQVEKNIGHATINVIVGVTSVGPSLCGGSTPAIYTRVYNYLSWIESVVWP